MVGGTNLLPPPPPNHTNFCQISRINLSNYIFVQFVFNKINFKLGNLTHLKALFPPGLTDFPNLSMSKVEKTNHCKAYYS